jgi:hypothetical protein
VLRCNPFAVVLSEEDIARNGRLGVYIGVFLIEEKVLTMSNLLECQRMLEQLQQDYPIPPTVRIKYEFHPGPLLQGLGRKAKLGQARQFGSACRPWDFPVQQATIHVAIGVPLPVCLDTVAHEYWHVVQVQTLGLKPHSRITGPFERGAQEFASKYTKEYMAKRCLT